MIPYFSTAVPLLTPTPNASNDFARRNKLNVVIVCLTTSEVALVVSPPVLPRVAVGVELCHSGLDHARGVVVDLISVPRADDPTWLVLHQLTLLLAVDPQRLQQIPVGLGEEKWFESDFGFEQLILAALPVLAEIFVAHVC